MRVLGIDPGLTRCGVGVVDGSVGKPLTLVDVGVVRTAAVNLAGHSTMLLRHDENPVA